MSDLKMDNKELLSNLRYEFSLILLKKKHITSKYFIYNKFYCAYI